MTCFYPKNFPVCDNCIAVREKINRGKYSRPGNGECICSFTICEFQHYHSLMLTSAANFDNWQQININKHTHSINTQLILVCSPSMDKALVKWTNTPTSTTTFSSSIVPLCVPLGIRLFYLEAVAGYFTLVKSCK